MDARLKAAISDIIDAQLGYQKQKDGTFAYEIEADYRDEMDAKTAIQILKSDEPMETFWGLLDEWYRDYEFRLRDDLENTIRTKLRRPVPRRPDRRGRCGAL